MIGILFLLSMPWISGITGLPVYYIEPMRIAVIIGILHFKKWTSMTLALALPFISFFILSHPPVDKAGIIAIELLINIYLFFKFYKIFKQGFLPMLFSIISSKTICYGIYLLVYDMDFFRSETSTDFLIAQMISTTIFSLYSYFVVKNHKAIFFKNP